MRDLRSMLIEHEDLKLKPYLDSKGKITLGIGRNIEERGITPDEALYLLDNDIKRVQSEAASFPWFTALEQPRKDAVCDMLFNLGLPKFLGFRGMLAALQNHDWDRAASEMMASQWAGQVGKRAVELATMMRTGNYS